MSLRDPSSPSQGRFIRAALIIFPAGTIILGIASFGIWWANKVKKEERSYRYATALRRDLSLSAIERSAGILRDVLRQPETERLPAVASFLNSSMGAENMGYAARRDSFFHGQIEVSNVDVELTGKQRPREVILVLGLYGDPGRLEAEAQALAELMAVAHAVTGESRTRTLRFAGVPLGVKDDGGQTALERLAAGIRGQEDRVLQVFVLGGAPDPVLAQVRQALRTESTGTIIHGVPATATAETTLSAAQALQSALMKAIE